MGAAASAGETSSRVRKWNPPAPAHHVQRQGIFLYSTGSAAHSPDAASFVRVQAGAPKKWAMPSQDWQGREGCQRVPDGIGLHSTETRPGRAASEKGRAFVCSGGELQPLASLCLPADLIWAFVWEEPRSPELPGLWLRFLSLGPGTGGEGKQEPVSVQPWELSHKPLPQVEGFPGIPALSLYGCEHWGGASS